MLLVVPIVVNLLNSNYPVALALIAVAGLSDGVDGFLAKNFGWQSRLGSLLDPAADKLLLVSLYFTLSWMALVPWGVTGFVIGRDVIIVAGALYYQWRVEPLTGKPSAISKANTVMQLLLALLIITAADFSWPARPVLIMLGAAVVFTSAVSGIHYVLAWSQRALSLRSG
jgi:cardiolipin synthase